MPFDGNAWSDKKLVPYAEMLDRIRAKHGARLHRRIDHPNDTSKTWQVEGYKGMDPCLLDWHVM